MRMMQLNRGMPFGNSPFGKQDMDIRERIAQKKQLYQKKAMKVVTTAHKTEKGIDKTIEDRRGRIQYLQEESEKANAVYQDYRHKMEQAKADYAVADDSQEQKDLELLQKEFDIRNHGSMELLTEEEKERLKNMGEMTEYQKLSMELYAQADVYKTTIENNNQEMAGESATIRAISIERLKQHGIVDAEVTKEKMLEAASKEIQGMLVEDAKEEMDEKAEEVQEKAEAKKEKAEEEENASKRQKKTRKKAKRLWKRFGRRPKSLRSRLWTATRSWRTSADKLRKLCSSKSFWKKTSKDWRWMSRDKKERKHAAH